jgi:anthranilate phosphoribosyltransferase
MKTALARVVDRLDLNRTEMQAVMRAVMTGECSDAQIGGFLVALRMKSESIDEIEGAARVMRELVTRVDVGPLDHLVDIVGTGGDGANLFNVSTAASFVVAAAGGHVAKHGNRAVSSKSGSADLLEQAGICLDLTPAQEARCIREVGVGFMFSVNHHSAMKHAIGPRRELGLRTLFNILGPLTNPAGVKRQLTGVFSRELCKPLAEVLGRLGCEHAMVVHARDGLDEISLAGPTFVAEWRDGEVRAYELTPEDVGLESQSLVGLSVADAAASLALITDALGQQRGKYAARAADMIALNAGAALHVAGLARSVREGVTMAQDVISVGGALQKLRELADVTQMMKELNA